MTDIQTKPPMKEQFSLPAFPKDEDAGETAWMDVIHRMEEVYSDVLRYQVELEEKNKALEEVQQFIMSVLTSMSDVLIVCNKDTCVEEVNQALLTLIDYSREEIQGIPLAYLLADDASKQKVLDILTSINVQNPVQDFEVFLLSSENKQMSVTFNCSPRLDNHGRQVGVVLVGRPTGELRRAYDALNKAHQQLKVTQEQLIHSEKMASLGRLVAGVAHELNNPISFVLGNIHVLQRYRSRLITYIDALHLDQTSPESQELRKKLHIDRILEDLGSLIEGTIEGAERTRDIVSDLKRFSAVDKEDDKVFNLTSTIHNALHWVTRDDLPAFSVKVDLPAEIWVRGTEGQLHQVVVNLVQNAIDATLHSSSPQLNIFAVMSEQDCEIKFQDNGTGIDPHNINRVFDPFFTTKPVGKGTGLGLSISYSLIERHGGKLSAANPSEGGATFTLRLPLVKAPNQES